MTKPTRPPHRLGFPISPTLSRVYAQDEGEIREYARWIYLQTLAAVRPHLLDELARAAHDAEAVTAWLGRYGLESSTDGDEWPRAYVRATRRAWGHWPDAVHVWHDRDDGPGTLVTVRDEQPQRQAPRPRKSPAHFVWLARYQSGERYLTIARTPRRHVPPAWVAPWHGRSKEQGNILYRGAGLKVVRDACKTLAGLLGLRLRPSARGRVKARDELAAVSKGRDRRAERRLNPPYM